MVTEKYQIETSDHRCDRCERQIATGGDYYSAVVFADDNFARRNFCVPCWNSSVSQGEGRAVTGGGRERDVAPFREGPPLPASDFYAFWRTRRPEEASEPPRRLRFDTELVLDFFRRLSEESEESAQETTGTSEGGKPEREEREGSRVGEELVAESSLPFPEDAGRSQGGVDDAHGDDHEDDRARETEEEEEGASREAANHGARASETGLLPRQKVQLRFVLALLLLRKKALNFESSAAEEGREWLRLSEKAEPERVYRVENPDLTDEELERVRDDIGELLQMNV